MGTLVALHADLSGRADAGYRPFIAIVALLVLMGIARLSFGPRRRGARLPPGSRTIADLGLLVPLRTLPTRPDAEQLRQRLLEHQLRASISAEQNGYVVLVFRSDHERANDLLQSL